MNVFNEFGPTRDLLGYPLDRFRAEPDRWRKLWLTGLIIAPLVAGVGVVRLVCRDVFR